MLEVNTAPDPTAHLARLDLAFIPSDAKEVTETSRAEPSLPCCRCRWTTFLYPERPQKVSG